jgi:hypothetical protein
VFLIRSHMRASRARSRRQAGAIEVTPAMIEAGVAALRRCVPLDVCSPLMAEEDIATTIYEAMRSLESHAPASKDPA